MAEADAHQTPERQTPEPGELHCQVLVVGAGPVGMTAAALLAARGIDVIVVEKRSGPSNEPKAISLDDESLRTYQQAGLETEILRVVVPGTGTAYYDSDDQLLFHGRAAVPNRLGYPFKNPFAQPDLEGTLYQTLDEHPHVRLLFSTAVVRIAQDADGVRVDVSPSGGGPGNAARAISASYVLGADGGRSTVRAELGIEMTGRSYDDVWLVVDTLGDRRTERYGMHHADPHRPHVVVPGLHGRCRYEFLLLPDECEAGGEPPFDLIERILAPYRSITPDQVERAVAYRFHALSADHWRSGRVFLLGDAAHMMPPFAGQGLNSGIRDTANLAWKLAAALENGGGEQLLDSYQQERKPHADAVIHSSERLGRVVMTRNVGRAAARDAALRRALATPEGREYLEHMSYRPRAVFTDGLVLRDSTQPLVGTQIGQPLVFWFEEHTQLLLDRVTGDDWSLVGVGLPRAAWSAAFDALSVIPRTLVSVPLDDTVEVVGDQVRTAIDLDTRLYEELGSARGRFVLLRPDRFVAAVVEPDRLAELDDEVRRWFARHEALVAP